MTDKGFIYILESALYLKVGFTADLVARIQCHKSTTVDYGPWKVKGYFRSTAKMDKGIRASMADHLVGRTHDWFHRNTHTETTIGLLPLLPWDPKTAPRVSMKGKWPPFTTRLPRSLAKEIRIKAAEQTVTIEWFVRRVLEAGFEALDAPEKSTVDDHAH